MKKIDQCFDEGWDGVSNNTKRRRGRPDVFSRNTEFAADDEYSKGMREGLARQWPYKPKSRYGISNTENALKSLETPEDDQLSIFREIKRSQGKFCVCNQAAHISGAKDIC